MADGKVSGASWKAGGNSGCQGEDRTERAGGNDGSFLGISPQNGEKCISLLLHYRPIPENSILCPNFKTSSLKQENFISLISILSTKHPLSSLRIQLIMWTLDFFLMKGAYFLFWGISLEFFGFKASF